MFDEKKFEKEVTRLLPYQATFPVGEIISSEFYKTTPLNKMIEEAWRKFRVYAKELKVDDMYIDEIDNLGGERFLTSEKVRGNGAFFAIEIYDSKEETR